MSGLLAVIGTATPADAPLGRALGRLSGLGTARELWRGPGALMAVARHPWEFADDLSGRMLVLEDADAVVAADASLYYRATLERALAGAGVRARGPTASHLIRAAYDAWGTTMASHLEGDFAFIVWDRVRRRLVAARDPVGRRALFFARTGSGVALSTSVRALTELPGVSRALNVAALGAQAAGLLWSAGSDTAFTAVEVLPVAHSMVWQGGRLEPPARFWSPPAAPRARGGSLEEAAQELRALLTEAATERLSADRTAVWMSGGWDSTSVFAAGRNGLQHSGSGARLSPVSMSYPPGDPGREDELIRQVADYWSADVSWVDSRTVPLLDGLDARAAAAEEPPAHLYELWNRELARATQRTGAHVVFDGSGGDQLFQVSDILLADLLRRGHLLGFTRHILAQRTRGARHLLRSGVVPLLPSPVRRAMGALTRSALTRHYMERPLMPWVRPDFAERHGLRERELAVLRAPQARDLAQRENLLYVTAPIWAWGGAYMHAALLELGMEVRSPLLDTRVMTFALARPIRERAAGRETKILLRRAMKGLLPDAFLAPRTRRTGVTVGFSRQRMREDYPALFTRLFREPLRLAELGIVDAAALRRAADAWQSRGDFVRVNLFHVMKVEFWLRGLDGAELRSFPPRHEAVA